MNFLILQTIFFLIKLNSLSINNTFITFLFYFSYFTNYVLKFILNQIFTFQGTREYIVCCQLALLSQTKTFFLIENISAMY